MDKIRGFPIYHVIKPGNAPVEYRKKENKKSKKISTKQLIKSYLCSGANSRCVVFRQCECLNACQYGQQYIKQTSEEKS